MITPRFRTPHARLALFLVLCATGLGAACGDDTEPPPGDTGAGGGTGAAGGTSTSSGGGGVSCGDLQTDPNNCGTCGHRCAPGQTCVDAACACGADVAAFAADVQPILTTSCAKALCHSGTAPKGSLNLTDGTAYGELLGPASAVCTQGAPLVVPGEPSESYVMHKLLGSEICVGQRMPPAASLPSDQIKTIADWICDGAPDN